MNIILDFDGVFVQSNFKKEKYLIETISNVLNINIKSVAKYITNNPGMNREVYFDYFLSLKNRSCDDLNTTKKLLRETFALNVNNVYLECEPNPHILKLLHNNMHNFYIISSGNKNEITKFLELNNIKNITEVYGGPSTKFENLIIMISKRKIKNDEMIFIGDGNKDFELANKAQLKCILVGEWSLEAENLQKLSLNKKNIIYTSEFKKIPIMIRELSKP